MNYLKEINAFYDWLETNPASSSEIVLWHALMSVNNKAGWIKEFTVAMSVLEYKTGLKKRTLERARISLQDGGRLSWRKRQGNQSAAYKMISLCESVRQESNINDAQPVVRVPHKDSRFDVFDAQSVAQSVAQGVAQPVAQCDAINKLNETKLNETKQQQLLLEDNDEIDFDSGHKDKEFGLVVKFFENNIRGITPMEGQILAEWKDKLGHDLVIYALEQAVASDVRNIKYIEGILKNIETNGVKSRADAEEQNRKHKESKVKPLQEKLKLLKGNHKNRFQNFEGELCGLSNDETERMMREKNEKRKKRQEG